MLKIPPYFVYVATLPCEALMSAKHAINDKLQGSVATYLRRDGVVNNQIKNSLLLSLSEKFLKSVNIWRSYKQECDCLVHFLHHLAVCLPGVQSARDDQVLACNFATLYISLLVLTATFVLFRCQGGIAAAAWQFYNEVGIVTGGNYDSKQVQILILSSLQSRLYLINLTVIQLITRQV